MKGKERVQVLVAAMYQEEQKLIKRMNLSTDAIVGNQCNQTSDEHIRKENFKISFLNRDARGVGRNRNTTLLYADGEILTFADEDMVFHQGYEEIIQKAFREIPDADAIVFNIDVIGDTMGMRKNDSIQRLHFFNALNYGTARISVRSSAIKRENIFFHTCFGGGTIYSAGEDSLFIVDMLKRGLKMYTHPASIATVDQRSSTWFAGYTEKYLYDKGVVFATISKRFAKLLCLQDLVRHRQDLLKDKGFKQAFHIMLQGVRGQKALRSYEDYKKEIQGCGMRDNIR